MYLIMARPIMKDETKPGCENPHFSWRAKDRESFAKGAAIDGFSGKGIQPPNEA